MRDCAVVSLLNTPAGMFSWYETFPARITKALASHGLDHIVGFKSYSLHSQTPPDERLTVHDEHDAPHLDRLKAILEPRLSGYEQVVLHTHSYRFDLSAFRALVNAHPNWAWWATIHTTPARSSRLKHMVRMARQQLRLRYPDRIFGCSETSAARLRSIYHPASVGSLVNGSLCEEDLERFEHRGKPITALFVGRLIPTKGIWIALEAARIIASRHPTFRLTVVGNGSELEPAKEWVHRFGLSGVVRLTGYMPDVSPFYGQADMVWVPSDPTIRQPDYGLVEEGLPLVALEAQGHGLPCLYSNSGGLPETQVEGLTGLLVHPLSAEMLASRTLELVEHPTRYHAMRRGIVNVRARWSMNRMVGDYAREYAQHFGAIGSSDSERFPPI